MYVCVIKENDKLTKIFCFEEAEKFWNSVLDEFHVKTCMGVDNMIYKLSELENKPEMEVKFINDDVPGESIPMKVDIALYNSKKIAKPKKKTTEKKGDKK